METESALSAPLENIGFEKALKLSLEAAGILEPVAEHLDKLLGHVLAGSITAQADCPSIDSSLRDGFAVAASDLAGATSEHPVRLPIVGSLSAGSVASLEAGPGKAVQITTGAPIPAGADVVLPTEYCYTDNDHVFCSRPVTAGGYILERGADVRVGDLIAREGDVLTPSLIGLLAASGIIRAAIHPFPFVSLITTGDEVKLPGEPLAPGSLYASNMVALAAWSKRFGIHSRLMLVPDSEKAIKETVKKALSAAQTVIIIGGTGSGNRDFTGPVLSELGWRTIYSKVRMRPGKNTKFGLLDGIPVFCLPGGPSAAETAFLQIVLPCLLAMSKRSPRPFPLVEARFAGSLRKKKTGVMFLRGTVFTRDNETWVEPLRTGSRLKDMAASRALIMIPENCETVEQGGFVRVQIVEPS